jgi:hypothetical protein
MPAALDDYGSSLVEVDGIGPGLGVRLIGQLSAALDFVAVTSVGRYVVGRIVRATRSRCWRRGGSE